MGSLLSLPSSPTNFCSHGRQTRMAYKLNVVMNAAKRLMQVHDSLIPSHEEQLALEVQSNTDKEAEMAVGEVHPLHVHVCNISRGGALSII